MTPTFPKRAMSVRRAERWLAANNPHPPGSWQHHSYAARFWSSQADRYGTLAMRWLLVAIGFSMLGLIGMIVDLTAGGAS